MFAYEWFQWKKLMYIYCVLKEATLGFLLSNSDIFYYQIISHRKASLKLEWKPIRNRILYTNICPLLETTYNIQEKKRCRVQYIQVCLRRNCGCDWPGAQGGVALSLAVCDHALPRGYPQDTRHSEWDKGHGTWIRGPSLSLLALLSSSVKQV